MAELKTDMSITEIRQYKKTEQHFYDGTQSRIQICFGESRKVANLKTPHEKG